MSLPILLLTHLAAVKLPHARRTTLIGLLPADTAQLRHLRCNVEEGALVWPYKAWAASLVEILLMCRRVRYETMARVGVLVQLLVVYDGRLGACVISKVVGRLMVYQVPT